jgi:hypothetical protein
MFLASEEAGFVTGIELRVDGGSVATLSVGKWPAAAGPLM